MPFFQISYDLMNQKNYDKVVKAIETFDQGRAKVLLSNWIVYHNKLSALDIAKVVAQAMDTDDKLFVVQISKGQFAYLRTLCDQWIVDNMNKDLP